MKYTDRTSNVKHLLISTSADGDVYMCWQYTDNLFVDIYDFLTGDDRESQLRVLPLNNPVDAAADYLFLPSAIKDNLSGYKVFAEIELVDGIPCHVLENPGYDKIWIAHEHGFVPMKREMYFGQGRPPGILWRVVTQKKLKEVRPGLWLPLEQIMDHYPDPKYIKDKSVWGKIGSRSKIVINEMEFDTLDDEFFQLSVPVGTQVQDFINDKEYTVRDVNEKPFESLINVIESEHPGLEAKRNKSSLRWLLMINGIVFIVLLAFIARQRFSGRQKSAQE